MNEHSNINDDEAMRFLDEKDKQFGINKTEEVSKSEQTNVTPEPKSLGNARTFSSESAVADSPWKLLKMEGLPSQGLFYPENSEILLRSAKTQEIRHWSTIDESDPVSVREKINFILNALTKFNVKGRMGLKYSSFLEVDRYHLLFRLYELTFPNQENKLWANTRCKHDNCRHINRAQVTSQNLIGFQYPEEIMKWYSPEDKCWVVVSEKLNKTIKLWLPTIGSKEAFRSYRQQELANSSKEIDEAFYEFGPYLLDGSKKITFDDIYELKTQSIGWSDREFVFIHKFTNLLKKSSLNKVACICEKCKQPTEDHIFLGGSFTVKDIFIISAGLDELI